MTDPRPNSAPSEAPSSASSREADASHDDTSPPQFPPGTAAPRTIAVPGGPDDQGSMPAAGGREDVRVDVRCSVLVTRGDSVLLLGRVLDAPPGLAGGFRHGLRHAWSGEEPEPASWELPGGRPFSGESMVACARRETREETGLDVSIGRCLFVLEVAETDGERTIDLVFAARPATPQREPEQREAELLPRFIALDQLPRLRLQPPIAGYLRGLRRRGRDHGAPYLGNLWRPNSAHAAEEVQRS